MNISVVIPLFNEDESLPELFAWIERVTNAHGLSHEVIFVDDGSTDRSWEVIEKLRAEHPDVVRGIKLWSSPWMPTCRILPTRFPNSTE